MFLNNHHLRVFTNHLPEINKYFIDTCTLRGAINLYRKRIIFLILILLGTGSFLAPVIGTEPGEMINFFIREQAKMDKDYLGILWG
ncbi:hypothetical protein P278_23290 [Zhouia amylolytica AD3]|uniref:Uncharacterized protein n=1 Tax=Zhouia amylolytica AD3 TaxID=1286632 RepID=W2UM42_9FLAO|nr:hypothetical protein P278_23290 [Zhouia amylolytica AD3]